MGTASLTYLAVTGSGSKSVQKHLQHPHCQVGTLVSTIPVSLESHPLNLPLPHASLKVTHPFFVPPIKPGFHYHASVWLQDTLLVPQLLPMTAVIICWHLSHIPPPHRNCHGRCTREGRAWGFAVRLRGTCWFCDCPGEYTADLPSVWLSSVLNLGEVVPSGRRFRDTLYVECFPQSRQGLGVSSYLLPGTHQLSSLHLYVL